MSNLKTYLQPSDAGVLRYAGFRAGTLLWILSLATLLYIACHYHQILGFRGFFVFVGPTAVQLSYVWLRFRKGLIASDYISTTKDEIQRNKLAVNAYADLSFWAFGPPFILLWFLIYMLSNRA